MELSKFSTNLAALSLALHGQHHVGGLPAEPGNQDLITQFYTAWLNLARDVVSQQDLSYSAQYARLNNFVEALTEGDLTDVLNICMDAAGLLIDRPDNTYDGFKHHLMSQYPSQDALLVRLISPVGPLLESFFECPDVRAVSLQHLLMFFRYGKKLNIKAIGLETQALTAYIECEDMLSGLVLEDVIGLVDGLNRIMRVWLRDLCLKDLIPTHGSGSVAEGKLSLYEKYKNLQVDLYLKIVLGPFWEEYYPLGSKGELVRISRTIFVPKTYAKLRTISMEPVTLQYFQQGVMKRLYKFIEEHPYLGRRISLRDQSKNQEMARTGSIDNSLSTIDLSAASDTVSWDLVKRVFAGTPLLKWLYATRSKKTKLPNGKIVALKKFAPMGSALCFPVECLIFAVVIEYVTQQWCKQNRSSKMDYSVFGDDLVVAKEITDEVVQALTALGFKVNENKTFVDGPFRESCGCDYYEGIDVSSVYYRLQAYKKHALSPEVYSAACSAINFCAEKGLLNLRRYLIQLLLLKKPYFTNTTSKSPQIWSSQPTNFHVKARWHEDYQMWVGRFCTVLSKPLHLERSEDDHVDDVAYFVKLAQMAERESVPPFCEPGVGVNLHGSRVLLGYVLHEVDKM